MWQSIFSSGFKPHDDFDQHLAPRGFATKTYVPLNRMPFQAKCHIVFIALLNYLVQCLCRWSLEEYTLWNLACSLGWLASSWTSIRLCSRQVNIL